MCALEEGTYRCTFPVHCGSGPSAGIQRSPMWRTLWTRTLPREWHQIHTCMTQWQSSTLSYRHTSNNSLSVEDLEYFNLRQHTSNKLINSRVILLTCLPWTEWWANSTPIPDMNLVYMELRSVSACCSALVAATSVSLADSPSILNR